LLRVVVHFMLDLLSKNDIDLEARCSKPAQVFRAPNQLIKKRELIIQNLSLTLIDLELSNFQNFGIRELLSLHAAEIMLEKLSPKQIGDQ